MSSNVNERYLEARVASASPVELVRMLYGAAGEAVREARRNLAEGDIAGRSRRVSKAMEILAELGASLNAERGGEIARGLAELYDYMGRRLLEANLSQAEEPLAEVQRLLATLEDGWDAAGAPEAAPQPAAAPMPQAPASRAYGSYGAFLGEPTYAPASQSWSA